MNKLRFSVARQASDPTERMVVESWAELTRMAIPKYNSSNFLHTKYTSGEDYNQLEQKVKESVLKLCADRAGLSNYDFTKREDLVKAFSNPIFEWEFFSIQTQSLDMVQADNEVEDILQLANITTVGMGDSMTYEIGGKSLYDVQEGARSNNVSRFQTEFKSGITIAPTPKIATVNIDVINMAVNNYDFGKQMAKIAMSFRTKMYVDVVNAIYTISAVPTAFSEAAFAKTSYVKLAERTAAANSSGVTALGTKAAWVTASNNVNTGYATQDEINRTGFIGNIFGVRSVVLNQAVDSNSAAYAFQVPDDRILLVSATGDKPAKVVKEGNIMVTNDDGKLNSLYHRIYSYQDAWAVGIATQAHYGIQVV